MFWSVNCNPYQIRGWRNGKKGGARRKAAGELWPLPSLWVKVMPDVLRGLMNTWIPVYKVDGQLIAISVLDITPLGVSSVYCIWNPDWAWASLGKLTALYEINLARRLGAAGAGKEFSGTGIKWVYMGYWVPNCQKMKYKSEYAPSYLLDPVSWKIWTMVVMFDWWMCRVRMSSMS